MHGSENVSPWVARWAHLVSGHVLDLACGLGRHSFYFLEQNCTVTSVDIAPTAIESIAGRLSAEQRGRCERLLADLENAPWPFAGRQFDAVIVTNYLWRPLLPAIVRSVAAGGVLIYETFAAGNETVGKPSRADFLLQPGELLQTCAGLRVVAYEDGFMSSPERFVQRIVAVNESAGPQTHQKSPEKASKTPLRRHL